MFKRYVAFFTAVIFVITIFPIIISQKVHAYQNKAYFNNVKVGLVSMSSTSLTLTLNGDYTLNGQVYSSGSVINLGISGTSITVNGTLQSQIILNPNSSSNLLMISSGVLSNKYMGSFSMNISNNKLLPINTLDVENYLKGVVGYEMSDSCPIESLKAQAVAARNYAISRVGYASAKGYDFDDTPAYQTYKGYSASQTNVISAVDQTRGQVLLYNDTLVETLYSAWHGGVSENSENVWGNTVPYLRSVQDPYENLAWPNGNITLSNSQIQTLLITKGYLATTDTFLNLNLNSIAKFTSGRVSNINIIYKDVTGITQTKFVTNDNTRTFLSLPSNLYTVIYDAVNGVYTFSGRGNGHGLGMSQIGAKNRAAAGQTYDQILKFYYQNVYLQNLILKATLSSLTQTNNSLYTGNNISFNTTASAGNGYGYLYKYIVKNGADVVFTRDYSSSSSLDYVPSNPGNYTVLAYVKDKYSISDYDDTKTSSFNVYGNSILNSYTLSSTNIVVGQAVSTNVDIQGGSGSYLYKYEVSKDGTILVTRDFLSDKLFNYTPSQPGNYTITAYIRDSISINPYDFKQTQNFTAFNGVKLTSFIKDDQKVFVGDLVNFTPGVSGGSDKGITYKYVVTRDSIVVLTQDLGTLNTLGFTPTLAGNYNVAVYAKDLLSGETYDDVSNLSFTVYSQPTMIYTSTKSSTLVGTAVNYNIAEINGTGNAQYRFVVIKDSNLVSDSGYLNINTFTLIPAISGTYQVIGYMKDAASEKVFDTLNTLILNVYNPQLTTVNASGYFYEGRTVTFKASSKGASPSGLNYRYEVYSNKILVASSSYITVNTFAFTTNTAGVYIIKVYGKDGLSTNSYDTVKQFNVTINSKPLFIATLPLSTGISNKDVVSLQNALIKLGYAVSGATGYFGSQTSTAVISFQNNVGIPGSGIVGDWTYNSLNSALIQKLGAQNLTF